MEKYKGVSVSEIIKKYEELKSVWKVGGFYGISGQDIHCLLSKLGKINKMNYWTSDDDDVLRKLYIQYRNNADLKTLAMSLNRTVPFISRKAKALGLTDSKNRVSMKRFSKSLSENMKARIKKKGHPRGMLGKKHTEKTKKIISASSKKTWADPNHYLNSEKHKQSMSDRMSKLQSKGALNNNYSRAKSGYVLIGGRTIFFRSEWEVNVCAYFEFLKKNNQIAEWEYEPITFWFHKIKRGVRSYKPDFRITLKDGTQYYEEVKGWMDSKSITKLKRMRIYYPDVDIRVLDKERYKEISKMKSIIPHWGDLTNGNAIEKEKCSVDSCLNNCFKKGLCSKHYKKANGKNT